MSARLWPLCGALALLRPAVLRPQRFKNPHIARMLEYTAKQTSNNTTYKKGSKIVIYLESNDELLLTPEQAPQVIADYLVKNEALPLYLNKSARDASPRSSSLREGEQINPIIQDFQHIINQVFQSPSCAVFAFVFGSAAKGKLRAYRDDLDIFICLNKSSEEAVRVYNQRLSELHSKYNLKIDETYPSEIMTLSALNEAIEFCQTLEVSIYEKISGKVFDNLFWIHSLSDKKVGFLGNGKLKSELIKKSQPHVKRWSSQIIEQITNAEELPDHLKQTFAGLSKKQIIEKLKGVNPHLVVHLGLSYLNNAPLISKESVTKPFSEKADMFFFSAQVSPEKTATVTPSLRGPNLRNTKFQRGVFSCRKSCVTYADLITYSKKFLSLLHRC